MVITKKYLVFPVSDFVKVREIDFYSKDKLLDDIYIKLDYINPKYNIYYPVEKYKGLNIDVIILDLNIYKKDAIYHFPQSPPH